MSNVIKAIQKIYPGINGGFVYWQSKQDGSPLDNPIDGLIWENTQYQKPTWEQIESKLSQVNIEEAKFSKVIQIENARKMEQYSNIIFEGNEYICSETAQTKYFLHLNNSTGDVNWRLADHITWITLTREKAIQLGEAIILREKEAYTKESTLLIQVDNAVSVDDINNINW